MYAVIFELEGQLDCSLHATEAGAKAEAARLSEKYATERANYSASVAVQGGVQPPAPYSEAPAMVEALRQVVALAELHIAERSATPEEEDDFLACAYLVNARAILARIDGATSTDEGDEETGTRDRCGRCDCILTGWEAGPDCNSCTLTAPGISA